MRFCGRRYSSRGQDMNRVVSDTWRSLTIDEREPYEMFAQQDMGRFAREKRHWEELERRYDELRSAAEQDGETWSHASAAP